MSGKTIHFTLTFKPIFTLILMRKIFMQKKLVGIGSGLLASCSHKSVSTSWKRKRRGLNRDEDDVANEAGEFSDYKA